MNWFVYCSNNPLRYVDPEGLTDVGWEIQQGKRAYHDSLAKESAGAYSDDNKLPARNPLDDRKVAEGSINQRQIQEKFDQDKDNYCAMTAIVQQNKSRAESKGAEVSIETTVEGVEAASKAMDPWGSGNTKFDKKTGDTHPLAIKEIYDSIIEANPNVEGIPNPKFIDRMSYQKFRIKQGSMDWDAAAVFYGDWGNPHVQKFENTKNGVVEFNTFTNWSQNNKSSKDRKVPFSVWIFKYE